MFRTFLGCAIPRVELGMSPRGRPICRFIVLLRLSNRGTELLLLEFLPSTGGVFLIHFGDPSVAS